MNFVSSFTQFILTLTSIWLEPFISMVMTLSVVIFSCVIVPNTSYSNTLVSIVQLMV